MTALISTTTSASGVIVHIDEHASGAVEINVEGFPTMMCESLAVADALCDALCAFFAEKRAIAEGEERAHSDLPEHAFA